MSRIYINERGKINRVLNELWAEAFKQGKQEAYKEIAYQDTITRYTNDLEADLEEEKRKQDATKNS